MKVFILDFIGKTTLVGIDSYGIIQIYFFFEFMCVSE